MNLNIWKNQKIEGIVDEIISCVWTVNYFNTSEFKILAPMNERNRRLLDVGNIVVKHDDEEVDYSQKDARRWRDAGQISSVKYNINENTGEVIEAVGFSLNKWLDYRVITQNGYAERKSLEEYIVGIVSHNAIYAGGIPFDSERKIEGLEFRFIIPETSNRRTWDNRNKNLGEAIRSICWAAKKGYVIYVQEQGSDGYERRELKYRFALYDGEDLTKKVIFSIDRGNVIEQSFSRSLEDQVNVVVAIGAEHPDTKEVSVVTEAAGSVKSLDRRELSLECTDISWNDENNQTIDTAKYEELLRQKARDAINTREEIMCFDSRIRPDATYKYKKDYYLGDRVTCINKDWNIKLEARITEITQTWEQGQYRLEAKFGESAPTLIDKLRRR